jgi:hypothetical protein
VSTCRITAIQKNCEIKTHDCPNIKTPNLRLFWGVTVTLFPLRIEDGNWTEAWWPQKCQRTVSGEGWNNFRQSWVNQLAPSHVNHWIIWHFSHVANKSNYDKGITLVVTYMFLFNIVWFALFDFLLSSATFHQVYSLAFKPTTSWLWATGPWLLAYMRLLP